ncbi:MAG: rhomboid family intramembrane serine protease [Prosthecobacter sp.]|jgi:membrane associated rhomboid family serine protease|uniref:rhomboid family intramembrane serine protease n=1 Tax=Prosthecobacter sp. TaxID=1965333 RepID=UPI001A0550DF|nr:rhomboid family intramembrane serine protease [Prosthecobacter sp.]MBE2283513.1 rhomboid family intramembrane serine protease [Prosthecobacter sp.]
MPIHERDYMREDPARHGPRGVTAFQIFLGLNIAVFVMQYVFVIGAIQHPVSGKVFPFGGVSMHELAQGKIWTLFTYMFVHGSLGHLALNMLLLLFAGRAVQQRFGSRHFTLIYLLSGLVGAAAEMTVNGYVRGDMITSLVGASASTFGLLMALAVAMPDEEITALVYFIIPVRLRLWTLAKGLFVIQLIFGLAGLLFDVLPEGMEIAYFAHLGGAAMGWFYARSLGYGGRPLTYASQWQPPPAVRRPAMARARTRRSVDLETEPPTADAPLKPSDPVRSLMEEVINPLLDKMNQHGKNSLTEDELRALERASREVNRRSQR